MGRLKRHVSHSQGRWSEVKEKEREKEGDEMTLCLYECLRAVGLQHHYDRFISVGVHSAVHLSALTMEDYSILGIRSMEDRTRLFHLVQMVKSLDLESLEYEDHDDDYNTDGGDEGYAVADCSFTYDDCGDLDEDVDEDDKGTSVSKFNATSFSKPSSVRRRLDFSSEITDHPQKLFSHPVGTVHVYASHNRINEPGQGKGSTIPVQLEHDSGSAVICSCKGNNNHKLDVHSHQSDLHTKPDLMERTSIYSSQTRLSPKYVSSHKTKPSPATAASKRFRNKPTGHKDRKGISRREKLYTEVSSNVANPTPVYESKRTAGYNYGLPLSSPCTPNKKQLGGQRISVCVRKRPLTRTECRRREADVVTTPSRECVIVHESKEAVDLTQYILQHKFYFDQVFGEESSNEEVYRRTAYPLVQHMLNGGKATCFAYGQTGAGKTHTMLGSSAGRPGLYALAVQDIFAHLSITDMHSPLLVYVSFFEIYCGQLFDLLDHRKRLFAREDGQKVVHIAGLRDVRVDSVSSLLEVISKGTEERTQGMSGVNPLSSRSHALLQIQLKGPNQQIGGRMWFVDLAGSERASDTKESDRQSRMEGAEINQSLLALKECIRSLDQEQLHTPFRQSKLTQVLKDSFVGDSMTCMIANISPGHLATEHTLNTLRYADRVKELRGQGGLRGGRRGKTIPSPKRNLSNTTSSGGSSVGTRGKSPPKKPKLGRQRGAFGPTTPTSRLDTILCSTPKNSRSEEKTSVTARKGIGIEQITPIRGLLGIDGKRGGAGGREGRRRETYGGSDGAGPSIGDQSAMAGLALGQATDENQQSNLKGGRDGERRWIEERRQVESSTDMCNEAMKLREIDLPKVDERYKERERHLRLYHQQLQQFISSSGSSSDHLCSPSASLSCSSSNQASLSSTVSPLSCPSLQHSSCLSTYCGLEEVLDMYRAKVEVRTGGNRAQLSSFPSGNVCLQTETSSGHVNKDEVDNCDLGGIGEDLRVSLEGTGAGFGQGEGKIVKRRSLRATGEAEVRVKQEDWRPAGLEGGGERRWAWVATAETEQADRMTGAGPADVESYNCYSEVDEERPNTSDVQADGVGSTEERDRADSYSLVSTRSNNPVQSPHQRAPAERPLSPACEHNNILFTPNDLSDIPLKLKHDRCTSNILPLPLRNAQQGVPSSSHREEEPWFAVNSNRREFSNAQSATLPLTTPITQNPAAIHVHNQPEVKAKMSALAQGDTSNSLSSIMDPLSMSLLQVDQQVTTASFLQGEQNIISLCPLKNERREDKRKKVGKEHLTCAEIEGKAAEDEDEEFRLSLLELPQAKSSDTMTATDHSEQRKDACCATYKYCGQGIMKPSIPEIMLASLQDHEDNQKLQTTPAIQVLDNKDPTSPLKPSSCASVETSVMQSISSSVQHSENTGSPSSCHPITNSATQMQLRYAHNKLAFSISTPQSESLLGQLNTLPEQCPTVHPNHSKHSNILLQPNSPTQSNSEENANSQQISPIIHLSTLEDLHHNQWRVVQAHWEQLEEMETLCRKEGRLLRQQPDMAFGEYVHKLGEIMERKAQCVHSMIAHLQPYLKTSPPNQ